jgi:hypothetical protein
LQETKVTITGKLRQGLIEMLALLPGLEREERARGRRETRKGWRAKEKPCEEGGLAEADNDCEHQLL